MDYMDLLTAIREDSAAWRQDDLSIQQFIRGADVIGNWAWSEDRRDMGELIDRFLADQRALLAGATPPGELATIVAVGAQAVVNALLGGDPLLGVRPHSLTVLGERPAPGVHPLKYWLARLVEAAADAFAHPDRPLGELYPPVSRGGDDDDWIEPATVATTLAEIHQHWFPQDPASAGGVASVLRDRMLWTDYSRGPLWLARPDQGTDETGSLCMQPEYHTIAKAELTRPQLDAFSAHFTTSWALAGRFVEDGELRDSLHEAIVAALGRLLKGEEPLAVLTDLARAITGDDRVTVTRRHEHGDLLGALDRRLGVGGAATPPAWIPFFRAA